MDRGKSPSGAAIRLKRVLEASAGAAAFAIVVAGLWGYAQAQSPVSAELGGEIVSQWCATCHATGDVRAVDVGPPFPAVARRRSPDYLRGFLANPHSRDWMPPFGNLSREQIEDIVAYIQTLKRRD